MPKADDEISIEDLYPDLTPEKRAEIDRRLHAFLEVTLRIWTRIHANPKTREAFWREVEEFEENERKQEDGT